MAREAKLVIATEDKTKAGIASAKAGMGQLVEAAKESKRQLEGINAVLQLGGWTMMASKAVNALRDITKEARENSEAFKESTKAFDDLRKELGASIVSAVEPMVSAIGKIAGQWAVASERYREYRDALKKDAEDRTLQDEVAIARGNLANIGEQLTKARAGTGTMGFSQLLVDKLVADYKIAEQQLRTAKERLNPKIGGGSGGGGASYPVQQVAGGLQVGTGNIPGFFQEWGLNTMLGGQTLTGIMEAADSAGAIANTMAPAIEDASQASLGLAENLSDAVLIAGQFSAESNVFGNLWTGALTSVAQHFTGVQGIVNGVVETMGAGVASALEAVGAALVTGQNDWSNLGKIALDTLAQILRGIAAQLAGLAAVKLLTADFVGAGIAAAAAVAALVGAGAAGAAASGMGGTVTAAATGSTYSPKGYSGGGAAYTGSQPITFNFYNQGNVVGSGGLEELAAIIEGLIQRRARYA